MLFQPKISKLVMRLGRRHDQDGREVDGAAQLGFGGTKIAKCVPEVWKFRILVSGLDWMKHTIWGSQGSHKIRFQCCMSSKAKNSSLYIRAIPGHTGGKLIASELLGHVAIPSRRYSIQLERVHISQRKFFRLYFNSHVRTRCWRKNKQRWTTNSFLRTSQPDI